jgi:NitT/TauT family transport system substrate-binding protein
MLGVLIIAAIVSAAMTTTALAANTFLLPPVFAQQEQQEQQKILRIGYFPNINHAQAVIGIGNGDFQRALGDKE